MKSEDKNEKKTKNTSRFIDIELNTFNFNIIFIYIYLHFVVMLLWQCYSYVKSLIHVMYDVCKYAVLRCACMGMESFCMVIDVYTQP